MPAIRANSILAALVVLLAACAANSAIAGFIRAGDALANSGHEARLLRAAGLGDCGMAGAAAGPMDTSAPASPNDDGDGPDRPAVRLPAGLVQGDAGSCGSESTSHSTGPGGANPAIPCAFSQVPQTQLTSRVIAQSEPAFDTPPPWAPLEPPRGRISSGDVEIDWTCPN